MYEAMVNRMYRKGQRVMKKFHKIQALCKKDVESVFIPALARMYKDIEVARLDGKDAPEAEEAVSKLEALADFYLEHISGSSNVARQNLDYWRKQARDEADAMVE